MDHLVWIYISFHFTFSRKPDYPDQLFYVGRRKKPWRLNAGYATDSEKLRDSQKASKFAGGRKISNDSLEENMWATKFQFIHERIWVLSFFSFQIKAKTKPAQVAGFVIKDES
jgi:hypothetical protein